MWLLEYLRLLGSPSPVEDPLPTRAAQEEAESRAAAEAVEMVECGLRRPARPKRCPSDDDWRVAADRIRAGEGDLPLPPTDMRTLQPGTWLNDEVINAYMQLLNERNARHREAFSKSQTSQNKVMDVDPDSAPSNEPGTFLPPSVYCWNSFFFPKLCGSDWRKSGDYQAVARWSTRKGIDVFDLDWMVVPVHVKQCHWVCAAVDMRNRRVYYLDSMTGPEGGLVFSKLLEYLKCEHEDKLGRPLAYSDEWMLAEVDAPTQDNGSDCGVFTCAAAEYISDGRFDERHPPAFDYGQDDVEDQRRLIALCLHEASIP
ncbi:MAG: hypothetical protein KVP17_001953 [Porospora cf. gigantea B]|uniref:uncharacterized protein n=1 Tax=Porospora cf. gigantea B TaxID=2853592 RepID=UPI0035717DF5|nr:MAG: hypothetical protein KVP17_001953 [Porospora cf. gigantea B]